VFLYDEGQNEPANLHLAALRQRLSGRQVDFFNSKMLQYFLVAVVPFGFLPGHLNEKLVLFSR